MSARKVEEISIGPQPGPQTAFLETTADIAFYGGAAGGGKSFGLLLEPLRHHDNAEFGGVIFRRKSTEIRNEGGLWQESLGLYSHLKAHPREAMLEWRFPSGMRMKFSHLEHEKNVLDWQGSAIPYIGFDELTHFTEQQFWYMLSRNRSSSGVSGYVRGTCNPDVKSWVRKMIDWYIGPDGYPIAERAGVIRWFIRVNDQLIWADSKEEIFEKYGRGEEIQPKSFTFIPSKLQDNKIFMKKDPAYIANLAALPRVDRLRLKDGNWNVRASAGMIFRREWFQVVETIPAGWSHVVRYWDRAATEPSEINADPDWTAGLKMYKYPNGMFLVADIRRDQLTPLRVEDLVKNTASQDGTSVTIYGEQDPGSAGVADIGNFTRMLAGYDVRVEKPAVDKVVRAKPVSAQCEAGNVKLLKGSWNEDFLTEVENFSEDGDSHDDQVDTLSGAFNVMCEDISMFDLLSNEIRQENEKKKGR